MTKQNKYYIIRNFGCPRRILDAERIRDYLEKNNIKEAKKDKKADYIIIVSCGLTKSTSNQVVNCIKYYQRYKGEILLYGCLPAMNPEIVESTHKGVSIITKDIETINSFFKFAIPFQNIDDANFIYEEINWDIQEEEEKEKKIKFLRSKMNSIFKKYRPKVDSQSKSQACEKYYDFILRISEGCLGNCSYCTIRHAIGKIKSKPFPVIDKELTKAIELKEYSISIFASDTGAYGLDIDSTFPEILQYILSYDSKFIIKFIQDLHPNWIVKYRDALIPLIQTKRIKSILTAIQSGNSRILNLMRRPVDIKKMINTMQLIKQTYPEIRLITQIIIGFPSESESDFEDSISVIKQCAFDEVHAFAYYEVKHADSLKIRDKIPADIILLRKDKLRNSLHPSTIIQFL